MRNPFPKPLKTFFWGFLSVVLFSALIVLAIVADISLSTRAYRKTVAADVPATKVGIVFGANVYRSGKLSPILQDRVDAGIELYNKGTIKKLLMTGDNGTPDYNEVAAMKAYALEKGVPEADITLDYAGFSTFDSCYRAKHIFGLDSAILLTQRYHAPRAVYTCRELGIDVTAYALQDFSKYADLRINYSVREYLADMKAWWQLHVTKSEATVLGNKEPEI